MVIPESKVKVPKRELNWPKVLFFIHLNVLGIYGLFVLFTNTSFLTILFTFTLIGFGALGVTAGSHRLWAHQTYKANKALKIFLMICQTLVGQGSIYDWVRMHRLHHKKFGTPDDPLYSGKDFFSSQIRAHLENLSPEQEKELQDIEMKDLEEDTIVMFQKKWYWALYLVLQVLLPINSPLEYWRDTVPAALFVAFSFRYFVTLNIAWLVDSAHFIWALNSKFKPSDSNSIFFITKSYWPQYHYLLPCDYQTGEFGDYGADLTTIWIRVFAAIGAASELKTITSDAVRIGLTNAVETDGDVVECIKSAAAIKQDELPNDHYLNASKFM